MLNGGVQGARSVLASAAADPRLTPALCGGQDPCILQGDLSPEEVRMQFYIARHGGATDALVRGIVRV